MDADLLVRFEIDNLPFEYRDYYAAKRNNFFASIQQFPEVWACYTKLDSIWLREFADLNSARDPTRMFPLLLYFNAHAKMRVGMELAFSGCLAEARSILRDAVECAAHAHAMMGDPELQKTWLNKGDGASALRAFKDAFEHHKGERVFKGLPELHNWWKQFSESGSHSNISAMCDRFVSVQSDKSVEFRLNYTGAELGLWEKSVFAMLLACSSMEGTLCRDYNDRLRLDATFAKMRHEFMQLKESTRRMLIQKYRLRPPKGIHVPRPPTIYRP